MKTIGTGGTIALAADARTTLTKVTDAFLKPITGDDAVEVYGKGDLQRTAAAYGGVGVILGSMWARSRQAKGLAPIFKCIG